MSDAARHAAYYIKETVYGTTPDTPAFKPVRHTGMTLGVQRGSLQSEELRPDRQISDFRLGAVSVAGDIVTELSFASFDDFLEAVLMGTWAPKATKTATTLSAAAADDSFNDSASGFVTAGFAVGDLITVSGFTGNTANNAEFRIASVAAGKITVTLPNGDPASVIVDDAAGESVTIQTTETVLKAGTVRRSFSVLRHFTDQTVEPFHLFKGIEFNTLALAVNPTAIVSATFGTLGREGAAPAASAPTGSTFAAATLTAPLDAFTGELKTGSTVVGEVTEFSINLENGLEVRNVVGSKLTIRPSVGRSNLTGSATVYFEDAEFLKKFINEEDTSLSIELPDGEGNSYIFTIPRFKFTGGQPDVSGQGSITLAMPFQGILDPATNSNIIVRRIPAAA
jgi:hypothetical protein